MIALCLSGVSNKALLHPEVEVVHKEAMSSPFYMLIKPCLDAKAPQSCQTTESTQIYYNERLL